MDLLADDLELVLPLRVHDLPFQGLHATVALLGVSPYPRNLIGRVITDSATETQQNRAELLVFYCVLLLHLTVCYWCTVCYCCILLSVTVVFYCVLLLYFTICYWCLLLSITVVFCCVLRYILLSVTVVFHCMLLLSLLFVTVSVIVCYRCLSMYVTVYCSIV